MLRPAAVTTRRVVVLSFTALTSACAASPSALDLAPLATRLQACGILGPGRVTPLEIAPFYAPDDCYVDCLASASCDALVARACGRSIDIARACDEQCAHRCEDGGLVAPDAVCNGTLECGDGSDERGCPTFRCNDGTTVPATARCNGIQQCSDGSDEAHCSNACVTVWGSEMVLPSYWRCDGYEECADASDEVGCTLFDCGNQQIITTDGRDVRCDGVTDCWQTAADERNCPVRATRIVECAP